MRYEIADLSRQAEIEALAARWQAQLHVLVNNEAGPVIDVEDLIQSPYTLEVSSPGLNRALKKERDFERFKDRSVKIRTHDAVGTRRNFRGRLLGCKKGLIKIEVGGDVIDIPL